MPFQIVMTVVAMVTLLTVQAEASCGDHSNCYSCTDDTTWFGYRLCSWCPLTDSCHTRGSWVNDCSLDHIPSSPEYCDFVADPPMNYDSSVAETLAKFSSLAYVSPNDSDSASIQETVRSQIGADYQVVEFVTHDCNTHLEFDHCAAVVVKSSSAGTIIVAFRGTTSTEQLIEQAWEVFHTLMDQFEPTGGEVLQYNAQTHTNLYPCVKEIIQELMVSEPTLTEVAITGHSLGGALAQLTAANLLADEVVDISNLVVYTFGSPRVGDKNFAFGYDWIIGNSWRVVRKDDPVPLIIPRHIFGFDYAYHSRREIFYDVDNQAVISPSSHYHVCQSNEDESCALSEGRCYSDDCFGVHQEYFVFDLPRNISSQISDGTPATLQARGRCHSYRFL